MLSISLEAGEYVTIGGSIVVKIAKAGSGRCVLAIEADKSLPIVRSSVLERSGGKRPDCLYEG